MESVLFCSAKVICQNPRRSSRYSKQAPIPATAFISYLYSPVVRSAQCYYLNRISLRKRAGESKPIMSCPSLSSFRSEKCLPLHSTSHYTPRHAPRCLNKSACSSAPPIVP